MVERNERMDSVKRGEIGPSMPRNSNGAGKPGDRILSVAAEMFCRDGIHATGIDRILAKAGTAKMTLYNQFGSKEGLIYAVLKQEGERWRAWFVETLDKRGKTPQEKLLAMFPTLEKWFAQKDYYGCAFINAIAEHNKQDKMIRTLTLEHKRAVLAYLEALAREAGCSDPADLAHQLGILMDGAIVAAMVTGEASIARDANQTATLLINHHLVEGRAAE